MFFNTLQTPGSFVAAIDEVITDVNETVDAFTGQSFEKKKFKDFAQRILDLAERLKARKISREDAQAEVIKLSDEAENLPEKSVNTSFINASILNFRRIFTDRVIAKGLPPEGSGLGYSKNGIFIVPGMRVRDKWGYAGTVISYNQPDFINVFIRPDIDQRDPSKVKGKPWGPKKNTTSKNTKTLTVLQDGDDQSPWIDTGKIPAGKKPHNLEEQLRLLSEMGPDGGEGPVGVVEPSPSPDDSGGDAAGEPKTGTTEALRENIEKAAKEQAWSGEESERESAEPDEPKMSEGAKKFLGPRKVGGRYWSNYYKKEYTVTAIATDETGFTKITVEWEDGTKTTHSTAWDKKDKIISEPEDSTLPKDEPLNGDLPEIDNTQEVTTKLGTDISTPDVTVDGVEAAPDHSPDNRTLLEKMLSEGPNALGSQFTANWVQHIEDYAASGKKDDQAIEAVSLLEGPGDSKELFEASRDNALLQNMRAGIAIFTTEGPQALLSKKYGLDDPISYEDYVNTDLVPMGHSSIRAFYSDIARYFDNPSLIDSEMTPASAFLRGIRSGTVKKDRGYERWVTFDVPITDSSHPLHQLLSPGQEIDLRPSSWTDLGNMAKVAYEYAKSPEEVRVFDGQYESPSIDKIHGIVLEVGDVAALNISKTSPISTEKESIVTNGRYRVVSAEVDSLVMPYPESVLAENEEIRLPIVRIRLEPVASPSDESVKDVELSPETEAVSDVIPEPELESRETDLTGPSPSKSWGGGTLTEDPDGVTVATVLGYDTVQQLKRGTIDPPALPFLVGVGVEVFVGV